MTSSCIPRVAPAILALALLSGCAIVPTPIDEEEISFVTADRLASLDRDQEPISGPIGLYEAMARALKYNLDHQVEIYQQALRISELDLSHFELLPKLVANSGYAERNEFNASSSYNILTNTQNFGASTSQERAIDTADISFSWNVLDFGLSYIRARQAADKVLIAEEMRRKAAQRIIEDVRTAFWRAVSAERLVSKIRRLEGRTRRALASARNVSQSGETSPITALTYERELVEVKRTLQELRRELSIAKAQLAALMNVKPGTRFTLKLPPSKPPVPSIDLAVPEMIEIALNNRPEVRKNLYKLRINRQELQAAWLELLPSPQLVLGANYDSNDFLFNKHWLNIGAKATWNLLKVFQMPVKREVIENQESLLEERGLALTMAIMTQVHVSRVRYYHLIRELRTAGEYRSVQRRLVNQIRVEAAADRVSEQTLIREELNTLVAEAKYDIAYADVQNGYANILASMGLDPHPFSLSGDMSLSEMSAMLRNQGIGRGNIREELATASVSR